MIASLLSEDAYSMFCLSAAMRVLLPENAMPIFIIDVTFIACKSTLYARSLICCKGNISKRLQAVFQSGLSPPLIQSEYQEAAYSKEASEYQIVHHQLRDWR